MRISTDLHSLVSQRSHLQVKCFSVIECFCLPGDKWGSAVFVGGLLAAPSLATGLGQVTMLQLLTWGPWPQRTQLLHRCCAPGHLLGIPRWTHCRSRVQVWVCV